MQSQPVLLPPFDPTDKDAKAMADQIRNQAAGDVLTGYLAALQKNAGVTINETLWRQISGLQTQ